MFQRIVLLGAGNANLQVLRWWGLSPISGASLTLVSDCATMPYSGMIPGQIAGQYRSEDLTVDVRALCAAAGAELVLSRAQSLDPEARSITLDDGSSLPYEQLAINIGSQPHLPCALPPERELRLKPLHSLMQRIEQIETTLSQDAHVVIVGGGAAGFEVCLALERRWCERGFRFTLLSSGSA